MTWEEYYRNLQDQTASRAAARLAAHGYSTAPEKAAAIACDFAAALVSEIRKRRGAKRGGEKL